MTNRTRRRIAIVALAPVAALSAWGLLELAGVDLVVTTGDGTVGAGDVAAAALLAGLAAWVAVGLLERYTRRPGFWWPPLGSTALALSTLGPSYFSDGSSAVALIALHVVTAIVLIYGFATTLEQWCDCGATRIGGRLPRTDPSH